MDEIQDKYKIKGMRYTPPYYAEAGMIVTLGLLGERSRSECPLCGRNPIVHGYIKNGKIRDIQRSSDSI